MSLVDCLFLMLLPLCCCCVFIDSLLMFKWYPTDLLFFNTVILLNDGFPLTNAKPKTILFLLFHAKESC